MKRFGFTLQKPTKQAYKRNKKAIIKWMKKDYPDKKKGAKKEKAITHCVDETGLRPNQHYKHSYTQE